MAFTGFSTDGLVGLPSEFFNQVAPAITLASELKVTLHIFYRLSQQRGNPKCISWDDLSHDQVLTQSLRAISKLRPHDELLNEGIQAAVRRTTLLHLPLPTDSRVVNWYLVNTPANRAWLERQQRTPCRFTPDTVISEQRSTLLTLYEQNIGLVTPFLVDELRQAEENYPCDWIEEAMREAVRSNVRSWRYVRKILERWAAHGRQYAPNRVGRPPHKQQDTDEQFIGLFRRGSDESDT